MYFLYKKLQVISNFKNPLLAKLNNYMVFYCAHVHIILLMRAKKKTSSYILFPIFSFSESAHSHSSGCFTAASTVLTSTGERRRLAELRLGEFVLSMDTRTGRAIYSEVIMFMDRDGAQQREFVHIATDDGAAVTATPGHLLYVWKRASGRTLYTYADRVEEGDYLLVHHRDGELRPQRVTRITAQRHVGVFAPLTREGTIVVDDVAASCYAMVDSQTVAHWSFAPVRAWRTMRGWIDTLAELRPEQQRALAGGDTVQADDDEVVGIHWYARALYSIKYLFLPRSWMYER